jgi:hypothetical protein
VKTDLNTPERPPASGPEAAPVANRYADMGFWQFTLITTLVTVFFPWYLIWNSLARGPDDTRLLMLAMAKDWLITVLTILVIVVVLVVVAVWAVVRYFSA